MEFWSFIKLPRGHVMFHTKFGPDRFSGFSFIGYKQTDKQRLYLFYVVCIIIRKNQEVLANLKKMEKKSNKILRNLEWFCILVWNNHYNFFITNMVKSLERGKAWNMTFHPSYVISKYVNAWCRSHKFRIKNFIFTQHFI